MAKVKDFLIGVEELIWTALESGASNLDSVYAYVYMYEPRADRDTVELILDELRRVDDLQLWVA